MNYSGYLLLLFWPPIVTGMRQNCLRSLTFFARQQRSLRRSRGSLARLLFTSSLVVLPPFQHIICSLRASRWFWAAPRGLGYWEENVCGLWISMEKPYPDWEEKQYLHHFWMSKGTFWYLSQRFGKYFKKKVRICVMQYLLPRD